MTRQQYNVLGIPIDLVDYSFVLHQILQWVESGAQEYICMTPPASVIMCQSDEAMRAATCQAGLRLPDGIGIVLAAQMAGVPHAGRVSGPSLTLRICDEGQRAGLRHYFYGGRNKCAEDMARNLRAVYPKLQIAGFMSPRFGELTAEEDRDHIAEINRTCPHIVWIGLGAPKQEKWMASHLGKLNCAAMIGVGAAFDFHAGYVSWAPPLVRKLGLEWAHRLALNPKKMWGRNVQSASFVFRAAAEALLSRIAKPARSENPRRQKSHSGHSVPSQSVTGTESLPKSS